MEPGFDVEGTGIDAASLEEELSRRVAQRRSSGACTAGLEAALSERLPDEGGPLPAIAQLDYSATLAGETWEVSAAYPVATDKKAFRPLIIFFKRLLRIWARIAVGPILREQSTFNRHAATALEAVRRAELEQRAAERAAEEDLCALAEAFTGSQDDGDIAAACVEALGGQVRAVVLGPFPEGLLERLRSAGVEPTVVSAGGAWDDPQGTPVRAAPLQFLSAAPEGSLGALVVPELAFWLVPERLVALTRRSYLALEKGGTLAIVVRSFAAQGPAPAWCSVAVVERALKMAGFSEISTTSAEREPSWHVTRGRR